MYNLLIMYCNHTYFDGGKVEVRLSQKKSCFRKVNLEKKPVTEKLITNLRHHFINAAQTRKSTKERHVYLGPVSWHIHL